MAKKILKFDDYYQAAEESLKRIWQNKVIWFWGLFVSLGLYLNFSEKEKVAIKPEEEFLKESFINDIWINYWVWIVVGFLIFLIFILIIWIISSIARSGVIKELDKKQNNKKYKLSFKGVWKIGKKDFKKILILDLLIAGLFFGVLIFDLSLIFLIFIINSVGLALFFAVIFGLATILILIFLAILKPIALIFLVLANLTIKNSLLKSWSLLKNNIKEYLKLVLTLFVILIIGETGLSLVLILGVIFGALLFEISGGFSGTDPSFLTTFLLFVLVSIVLFIILAIEGFVKLWKVDVKIWWFKNIKGVRAKEKEKVDKENKVVLKKKVITGLKV